MRLVLLGVTVALTGCAGAVHTLAPAADADRLAWANRLFGERLAVVVLMGGDTYDVEALRLAPDTTTWVDPVTREFWSVPTSAIVEVERRDPKRASGRFVRRGAVLGAAAGVVVGAIGGYQFAEACFFVCPEPTAAERVGFTAAFGVAGAFSGALAGTYGGIVTSIFSEKTERLILLPGTGGGVLETPANGGDVPNRAP